MSTAIRAATVLLAAFAPLAAQARVDLTAFQTPIRNQGSRTTCIVFAATAALEARYMHSGTTVDLSEEFVNYIGKMCWLHPYWSAITTADTTENQLGATAGGGGVGHCHNFVYWEKVPLETAMPYRSTEYPLSPVWSDPYWQSQQNSNDWNLDPAHLPRSALSQTAYYSATGLVDLGAAGAISPAAIEAALQAGYEVVWDFDVRGDRSGTIWHASSAASIGGHSMLIVGYDRTSANPANQYFIVKNSWGPTGNPGDFTYIGYDYIQYGLNACYLTGAATPSAWPELRIFGRRNISFDGFHGTLDIYHMPGSSTEIWSSGFGITTADDRLGTFYDSAGTAYRVNGYIAGNTVNFWFKGTNPNMRWDEQRDVPTLGRMFSYTLLDNQGDQLAGVHWDNAGPIGTPAYGGYAIRASTINGTDGFLTPVFNNSLGWVPDQWVGEWIMRYGTNDGAQVVVQVRDDSLVPPAQLGITAGYHCWYRHGVYNSAPGDWVPFTGFVAVAGAATFGCTLPTPSAPFYETFHMLTWERGVAGAANVFQVPFGYMHRIGNHSFGSISTFGTACGPAGGVPALSLSGLPELLYVMTYTTVNLQHSAPMIMSLGVSRTTSGGFALPLSLTSYGAPGCFLNIDPFVNFLSVSTSSGAAYWDVYFDNPSVRGLHVFAQSFGLVTGYNALGITASNGVDLQIGGVY